MVIKTTIKRSCAWWVSVALVCASSSVAAVESYLPGDAGLRALDLASATGDNILSISGSNSLHLLSAGELPAGVTVSTQQEPVTGGVAENLTISQDLHIGTGGLVVTEPVSSPHAVGIITASPIESDAVLVIPSEPPSAVVLTSIEPAPMTLISEPAVVTGSIAVAAQAEVVVPQSSGTADFIEMPASLDGSVDLVDPASARLSGMGPGVADVVHEHNASGVGIRGGHLVSGGL